MRELSDASSMDVGAPTLRRDLSVFLVRDTLAVAAAFAPSSGLGLGAALGLVVLYAVYVR